MGKGIPEGKQHHGLQTNKEGEKKQAKCLLYFNVPRIVWNLHNQGNDHCSGSTQKKPVGSCGRYWEGYEKIKYFRGLWSIDFFLFEDIGSVCQRIFPSLSKKNTLKPIWTSTGPGFKDTSWRTTYSYCLHLLFLPDRKRLKKKKKKMGEAEWKEIIQN